MIEYRVITEGDTADEFTYAFDGEPQINLTFNYKGTVYKITTRAHDEDTADPTVHVQIV